MILASSITDTDLVLRILLEPGDPVLKKNMILTIDWEKMKITKIYSVAGSVATVRVKRGVIAKYAVADQKIK